MKGTAWVDGVEDNTLEVSDRGLSYGDGVFETLLIRNGRIVLELLHWQRLRHSCQRLAIDVEWSVLEKQVKQYLKGRNGQCGIVKVIITRGSGGRGYNPEGAKWRSVIQSFPLPDYPDCYWIKGIKLYPCETKLAVQPLLAGMKHLNRLEQVLARQEWSDKKYAEGLLQDYEGRIIECTMSNIFIVVDGCLITPDLQFSGVAGVMRQWIIDKYIYSDKVKISNVSSQILQQAEEVFICNSVFGIWPVAAYASFNWVPGPVTRQLQKKAEFLFNDKVMD